MALIHASGYPIYHTFNNPGAGSTIYYDILKGDTVIYSGKIITFNSDATVQVDIAPVVREYLSVPYETFAFGLDKTVRSISDMLSKFTVSTDGGSTSYSVIYDYNTDYKTYYDNVDWKILGTMNFPISSDVDPRQKLFVTSYDIANSDLTFLYKMTAGANYSQAQVQNAYFPAVFGMKASVVLNAAGIIDTIWPICGAGTYDPFVFKIVPYCANRFALYYVNKRGGLDSLLCTGKIVESWTPERTDVQLYNDRANRLGWEQKRIYQEIKHQWQLNTGFIKPELLGRVDHLIYSPKVFLHDLEKGTMTTVLITDSEYKVKSRINGDKPFYTFTVMESQKQIRM